MFVDKNTCFYNNHKTILEFHKIQFHENLEILPSLKSRIPATNPSMNLGTFGEFGSTNNKTRYINNFAQSENLINPLFEGFAPGFDDLKKIQPQFKETAVTGIINVYRHTNATYEWNDIKANDINTSRDLARQSSAPKPRRVQIRSVADAEGYPNRPNIFGSQSEDESSLDPLDVVEKEESELPKIIPGQNFSSSNKSSSSLLFFANLPSLPLNVFNFIPQFPVESMIKLYNVPIPSASVQKKVPFLLKQKKCSINKEPLKNEMLIHCFSGIMAHPSFVDSHTLVERLIDKYPAQFDFLFFYDQMHPSIQIVTFIISKIPSSVVFNQNITIPPVYLKKFTQQKFKSEFPMYYSYFNEPKNQDQVKRIQYAVLDLMKFFKLLEPSSLKNPSRLDIFKFNEILRFIVFESFLVTQLEFCEHRHKCLRDAEVLLSATNRPDHHRIFHSFSFNQKIEISLNKIIPNLSFYFPIKKTPILEAFVRQSIKNIQFVVPNILTFKKTLLNILNILDILKSSDPLQINDVISKIGMASTPTSSSNDTSIDITSSDTGQSKSAYTKSVDGEDK